VVSHWTRARPLAVRASMPHRQRGHGDAGHGDGGQDGELGADATYGTAALLEQPELRGDVVAAPVFERSRVVGHGVPPLVVRTFMPHRQRAHGDGGQDGELGTGATYGTAALLEQPKLPSGVTAAPVVRNRTPSCRAAKCCSSLRTEEYLSVAVGFAWFMAVSLLTLWDLAPGKVARWQVLCNAGNGTLTSSNGSSTSTFMTNGTQGGGDAPALAASFTHVNVLSLLLCAACTVVTMAAVQHALRKPFVVWVNVGVCLLAFAGQVIGTYVPLAEHGFGPAVWCLVLGSLVRLAVRREMRGMPGMSFAIMVSIVLLAVNLKTLGLVGAKALLVAWVETTVTLVAVYYLGRGVFCMPADDALVTAAGLSICGSSAVVSVSEAISAEPSLQVAVVAIMSVLTVPCMVGVPLAGMALGLNNETIGAWVGGSVDSTGAVIASASLTGAPAVLRMAVVVKMLQNVMIGPVVVGVTLARVRACRCRTLWEKFPKFVLGFLVVAAVTTAIPDPTENLVAANSFVVSEWFSSLSFVLLGYDLDLLGLRRQFGGYLCVLALYVVGQFVIDTFATLGAAYLVYAL